MHPMELLKRLKEFRVRLRHLVRNIDYLPNLYHWLNVYSGTEDTTRAETYYRLINSEYLEIHGESRWMYTTIKELTKVRTKIRRAREIRSQLAEYIAKEGSPASGRENGQSNNESQR